MAVPTPVAANRRPVTTIRSRTREPRYAPSPNRNASVRTAPVTVAGQKPITRNGTTGIKAAIMGATPWTPALTRAAARNADRCSSLSSTSIARSMLWRCSFFSTRSASYAPTAELIARAIAALALTARTRALLAAVSPRVAAAPITIPRTVSAPSNAPITKYRRTIGPMSVTSSSSRHHSRHDWRAAILHARAQGGEHLASRSLQGLVQGLDLRARALREVRLPPALPPEHREGRLDHGAGVPPAVPPPRDDDARGVPRRPEDRHDVRRLREPLRKRQEVLHPAPDPVDDDPHAVDLLGPGDQIHHRGPRLRGAGLLELPPHRPPLLEEPVDGLRDMLHGDTQGRADLHEGRVDPPDLREGGLPRHVLEPHDAVLDPLRPEELHDPDVARPRDVGPAARLDVPLRDLDEDRKSV